MTRRLMLLALGAAFPMATLAAPAVAQSSGDFHWDKALPAGNEVEIHNINGDIKVVPSTNGRVSITGVRHGHGDIDLLRANVDETSHGIVVCVLYDDPNGHCDDDNGRSNRSRRGRNNWRDASMNFEVAVPANLTVSASSVSGDVSIDGAQGDISANSVSGDIHLQRLRAKSLSAQSVSGDVDVRIDQLTGGGDLSFQTVSGDVTVELPRELDADISMSTVSGDLDSDYPITLGNGRMNHRNINARIGKGGRRMQFQTVSGDVRLRKGA